MAEEEECTACKADVSDIDSELAEVEQVLNMARTMTRTLGDKAEELHISHLQDTPRFPPLAYHLRRAYEHLGQAWHIVIDEMRLRENIKKEGGGCPSKT